VTRRHACAFLLAAAPLPTLAAGLTTLRGKLVQKKGEAPYLDVGGKPVALEGDEPTSGVLNDERLAGADFEVVGQTVEPGRIKIEPIHTRSLFLYQQGKRLMVTYWCDICYIRTYTPGVCWCCQDWTRLDPKDPDTPDPKP